MIYIELFLTFLQVGAVSFGGGYAMISLIREKVLEYGWLSEEKLINMIAVSESTPGPIAVNMATFVGSEQGGILGSFLATLGVVLPSFIIILFIAALLRNFLKYKAVNAALKGIRPCIIGLIISTAVTMFISNVINFKSFCEPVNLDAGGLFILAFLFAVKFISEKYCVKKLSPIIMIIISAGLGIIIYSF